MSGHKFNIDALNALVAAIEAQTDALAENTQAIMSLDAKMGQMKFDTSGRLKVADGIL